MSKKAIRAKNDRQRLKQAGIIKDKMSRKRPVIAKRTKGFKITKESYKLMGKQTQ